MPQRSLGQKRRKVLIMKNDAAKSNEANYWLDLFSWKTWQEFLKAGGDVSGFNERRWNSVKKMKAGDYLLAYLTGISRWIGVLEVVSEPFQDHSVIWSDAVYPCRVKVKMVAELTPETAVPILDMKGQLSIFQDLKNSHMWQGPLRSSANKWRQDDGQKVVDAVLNAVKNPVEKPYDKRRLERKIPVGVDSQIGPVVIPDPDEIEDTPQKLPTEHTEIQWLLLKFGGDLGLDVWVATSDRNRSYNGQYFNALPHLRDDLPTQFDSVTTKTIRNIDVLWLDGNTIVGAFEIESTTSVYSGLLRMADLLAMQPNLSIPLYIVAPEERRHKVIAEVNRPTFSNLSSPLSESCGPPPI